MIWSTAMSLAGLAAIALAASDPSLVQAVMRQLSGVKSDDIILEAVSGSGLVSRDANDLILTAMDFVVSGIGIFGTPPQNISTRTTPDVPYFWMNPICSKSSNIPACAAYPKFIPVNDKNTTTVGESTTLFTQLGGAKVDMYRSLTDGFNVYYGIAADSDQEFRGVLGFAPTFRGDEWKYEGYLQSPDVRIYTWDYEAWILENALHPFNFEVLDIKKFSGPLVRKKIIPAAADSKYPFSQIKLDEIRLASKSISYLVNDAVRINHDRSATYLPKGIVDELRSYHTILSKSPDGRDIVKCPTQLASKTVDFKFGDATVKVPYTQFVTFQNNACYLDVGISGNPIPGSNDVYANSLGLTFMRSAYLVYDWSNKDILIAQRVNCGTETVTWAKSINIGGVIQGKCPTSGTVPSQIPSSSTSVPPTNAVSTSTPIQSSSTTTTTTPDTSQSSSASPVTSPSSSSSSLSSSSPAASQSSSSPVSVSQSATAKPASSTSGTGPSGTASSSSVVSTPVSQSGVVSGSPSASIPVPTSSRWTNGTTTSWPTITSVVTTTKVYTVTSCKPTVTNCPVGKVTTEIVTSTTVYCPGKPSHMVSGGVSSSSQPTNNKDTTKVATPTTIKPSSPAGALTIVANGGCSTCIPTQPVSSSANGYVSTTLATKPVACNGTDCTGMFPTQPGPSVVTAGAATMWRIPTSLFAGLVAAVAVL